MPRVSLILPTIPGDPRPDGLVGDLRRALADAGHDVEVIVASGLGVTPGQARSGVIEVAATHAGLASAAMAGLDRAEGDAVVVLDPRMGYDPASVVAVVAPLAEGRAELVVGSRWPEGSRGIGALVGRVARPFTGSTDPLSGLVGITKAALDVAIHRMRPVGAKISLEMLARVEGRREDVAARPARGYRRRPGWDDVRHLKRLADHRYGNASRLIQYCVVGASGMVVDLSCYFVFQKLFEGTALSAMRVPPTKVTVALALSRSLAIAVALAWNFGLNRRMTFSYARSGSLPRQFAAYAASNLLGVMVSLALSLGLPSRVPFFRDHKLAAAVVGIVAATGISFSMSRWVVFRRRPGDEPGTSLREGASSRSGEAGTMQARVSAAADGA